MAKPDVTSILAAEFPYALAEFYAYAINGQIQAGVNATHFLVVNPEGFKIQIYQPSKTLFSPVKGRAFALCLEGQPSLHPLEDLSDWVDHLQKRGAKLVKEGKLEEFGAEAWISDPEGNEFLLLIPLKG